MQSGQSRKNRLSDTFQLLLHFMEAVLKENQYLYSKIEYLEGKITEEEYLQITHKYGGKK